MNTLVWSVTILIMTLSLCHCLPNDWPFQCNQTKDSVSRCVDTEPDPLETMPVNLTIAFYGDQGLDSPPYLNGLPSLVMRMLKNESVDAIIHAGDNDYSNNPTAWDNMLNGVLGIDFPYFSAIGNHELPAYNLPSNMGYNQKIYDKYIRIGAKCLGDVGRDTVCSFKGFTFVLSGVGTSTNYGTSLLDKAFDNYGGIWRACVWHKNQRTLQLGDKADEVGFEAYNICSRKGAFIATGHEHSYSRSKAISYYQNPAPTYFEGPLVTQPNLTFVFVSGVAGKEIRVCTQNRQNNPWWGSALCAPNLTSPGALICKFNLNGVMRDAYCYFKTTDGKIRDEFYVRSNNVVQYYKQHPVPESEPEPPSQIPAYQPFTQLYPEPEPSPDIQIMPAPDTQPSPEYEPEPSPEIQIMPAPDVQPSPEYEPEPSPEIQIPPQTISQPSPQQLIPEPNPTNFPYNIPSPEVPLNPQPAISIIPLNGSIQVATSIFLYLAIVLLSFF